MLSSHSSPTGTESCEQPSVLVVLCTYNEIGNLPLMLSKLNEQLPRGDILVVDDSSPDGSPEWVREQMKSRPELHLLQRPGKLGLGSALRDAIQWCLQHDYDFLINLDADLSHDPAAAPLLLDACDAQSADVAVGTRYRPGGASPGLAPHRKLISRCLNLYANFLLGLPLSDCSGSFRCYRTDTLRKLNLEELTCTGYGFLEEILVGLQKLGASFAEVPIVFDCRHAGKSKLTWRDATGAIRVIHRLAWQRNRL